MRNGTVRIDRVITEADMRLTRKLAFEDYPVFAKLRAGHVVLLINRARTILRFVDCHRGIHTLYAQGGTFDQEKLVELCNEWNVGIALHVIQNRNAQYKPEPGISLEPMKRRNRGPQKARKRKRKAA